MDKVRHEQLNVARVTQTFSLGLISPVVKHEMLQLLSKYLALLLPSPKSQNNDATIVPGLNHQESMPFFPTRKYRTIFSIPTLHLLLQIRRN